MGMNAKISSVRPVNRTSYENEAPAPLAAPAGKDSGAITKAPDAAIEFTPLLSSSTRSGPLQRDQLAMPEPAKMLANFKPEGGPRVLAARIRGQLKSAFTGPPELPAKIGTFWSITRTWDE
jgi:ABC-type uncharacterized transport system involved in gliding motility auxiliary subunit